MTAAKILHGEVWNWSLDFLGCVYLGYRPQTVPTFALALPKRICVWLFLREDVSSVSVEKATFKASVLTHLMLIWPHGNSICCNINVSILTAACKFCIHLLPSCSTRELKGFSQNTQELFGNQEIPVHPHPLWSQLCLELYPCRFRNAMTGE